MTLLLIWFSAYGFKNTLTFAQFRILRIMVLCPLLQKRWSEQLPKYEIISKDTGKELLCTTDTWQLNKKLKFKVEVSFCTSFSCFTQKTLTFPACSICSSVYLNWGQAKQSIPNICMLQLSYSDFTDNFSYPFNSCITDPFGSTVLMPHTFDCI